MEEVVYMDAMKTIRTSFLLSLLFLFGCGPNVSQDSLRSLNQGEVVGIDSENNTFAWKGIPFAQPPIGELRWKAPLKAGSWRGRLRATEFKSGCFQRASLGSEEGTSWSGSEDCLYLNIWSPKYSPSELGGLEKKLPVMMWIHGGGNAIGDAEVYDPSLLSSVHDVIVVTIQYRMGPLGWFRHPALTNTDSSREGKSGNFGTLDTIMALRWIKENIESFGGDKHNVTVFGESAGGHNTAAIFSSPLARGLFHKAIIQSGIVSHSSIQEAESYLPKEGVAGTVSSKEIFSRILISSKKAITLVESKELQNSMTDNEIANLLRNTPPEDIFTAFKESSPKKSGMTRVFPDGYVIPEGGIYESFTNPEVKRVPVIFGTNKDENKLFNALNPRFVKWEEASGVFSFIGNMPVLIKEPEYYDALSYYGSADWKRRAADTPARKLVESGHKSTFVYRFDWDELPLFNGMDYSKLYGAAHALEIIFVMGGALDNNIVRTFIVGKDAFPAAKKLSEQIMSYWGEFAYTGNPGKGRKQDLPEWKSWSLGNEEKYIVFDSENDKGIFMSKDEYTGENILSKLLIDDRLHMQDKCETLFGISYSDGSGFSEEVFNDFAEGACMNLDYSQLVEEFEDMDSRIMREEE